MTMWGKFELTNTDEKSLAYYRFQGIFHSFHYLHFRDPSSNIWQLVDGAVLVMFFSNFLRLHHSHISLWWTSSVFPSPRVKRSGGCLTIPAVSNKNT